MSNVPVRLESVFQNGYNFRLGDYISQGFSIFGKNVGLFIGYTLVYFLIGIILSSIPYIGQLASSIISGALSAGFFIVAHKTENKEYVEFSNFFDGFKEFVPLLLVSLISGLLVLVALIPAFVYVITTIGISNLMELEDIDNLRSILASINISTFFILAFVAFLRYDLLHASATAKLANMATNLGSITLFLFHGNIIWLVALPMAVSNALGGAAGAKMAIEKGNKFIRIFFLFIVFATLVVLCYNIFTHL